MAETFNEAIFISEILKFHENERNNISDQMIVEEPLEIQMCKSGERPAESLSVTMRTPGHDLELALGFLFTEGIISKKSDISHASYPEQNVIRLAYEAHSKINLESANRNFYTNSSCGVCGKASIDSIKIKTSFLISNNPFKIDHTVLKKIHGALKESKNLFSLTGGNHAALLFNKEGNLLIMSEDVGRHNAMDKLVGSLIQSPDWDASQNILLLSGRLSFELIQKATMIGVPVVAAMGAPSSLAVETAKENDQCLIGFLKNDSFNIYSSKERIKF